MFYFSTGINLLCALGGAFSIDADLPSTEEDTRVDYIGAFLITAGLTLIIFVLSDGSIAPDAWATPCSSLFKFTGLRLHSRRHHRAINCRRSFGSGIRCLAMVPREKHDERVFRSTSFSTNYEAIHVDTSQGTVHGHANDRFLELVLIPVMELLGSAVLSGLPAPEPRHDDGKAFADDRHRSLLVSYLRPYLYHISNLFLSATS